MKNKFILMISILLIGNSHLSNAQNSKSMKKHTTALVSKENTVLLLVDHQVGLLSGVRDYATAELTHNIVALAKAAKVLGIPVIITAVGSDGLWGPTLPELLAVYPEISVIKRTTINAWDDSNVVRAVRATGRNQLLVAGISLEVCASMPAIAANEAGFDARVVLDASGTFNESKRIAGLQRLQTLGIQVTDYATAAVELLKDNASPLANELYNAIDLNFANIVYQLNDAVKKGYK